MKSFTSVVIVSVAGLAACDTASHERPALRAALEQSALSLRASIGVAATEVPRAAPVRAALVLQRDALFSVGALEATKLTDVRIDSKTGKVLSLTDAGTANSLCADSIGLIAALDVAEAEAGGEAIAVVGDDDVACAFEIQVLVGTTLWEVKVASDRRVLERELSDEYSGSEDPSD